MTAQSTDTTIRLLGEPTRDALAALRDMLLYCHDNFPSYTRSFQASKIDRSSILADNPITVLTRLPVIDADNLADLSTEAMSAVPGIVDTETSSGTTSDRKIRLISHEDDRIEHEFLADVFRIAGIRPDDRVACLDTDPVAVMVSFPRACELLGTSESYCISTGSHFDRSLDLIQKLRPTVLVSVPSIIQRAISRSNGSGLESVRIVVTIGEGLTPVTKDGIEAAFSAEVRSYYGTSETSGLGIECPADSGIHLIGSRHLLETDGAGHHAPDGDLIVTTLSQRGLPLLRYRVGDVVRTLDGACPCGLNDPRVEVLGRSDLFASILGSKIHHTAIHSTLQTEGLSGPLQVELGLEGTTEVLKLRLTDSNKPSEEPMRRAVLDKHADLEFLADSGLLDIRFEFLPSSELLKYRKPNGLIDRRHFAGRDA